MLTRTVYANFFRKNLYIIKKLNKKLSKIQNFSYSICFLLIKYDLIRFLKNFLLLKNNLKLKLKKFAIPTIYYYHSVFNF